MVLLVLLSTAAILLFANNTYRKWINPISVFVFPHAASLIMLLGSNFLDNDLSYSTYFVFYISLLSYTVGAYFSTFSFTSRLTRKVAFKPINIKITNVVIIGSIILDIIIFLYVKDIQNSYGIVNAFLNLSKYNQFVQTEGISSSYNILVFLAIPWSLFIHGVLRSNSSINSKKINKVLLVIQFVICFIPFISARRSTLLLMIVMNLFFYYFTNRKNRKHNYKRILFVSLVIYLILLFFSVTQQMMNKGTVINMKCFGITIPKMLTDIFGYFAGNYKYLDYVLNNGLQKVDAPLISTLRVIYTYVGRLFNSDIDTITPFSLRFVEIGNDTYSYLFNTVPIQYYLMLDSGYMYFFELMIFGFCTGRMYQNVLSKCSLNRISICSFQFSLVLMSFREYDLLFLSSFVLIMFCLCLGFIRLINSNGDEILV